MATGQRSVDLLACGRVDRTDRGSGVAVRRPNPLAYGPGGERVVLTRAPAASPDGQLLSQSRSTWNSHSPSTRAGLSLERFVAANHQRHESREEHPLAHRMGFPEDDPGHKCKD